MKFYFVNDRQAKSYMILFSSFEPTLIFYQNHDYTTNIQWLNRIPFDILPKSWFYHKIYCDEIMLYHCKNYNQWIFPFSLIPFLNYSW